MVASAGGQGVEEALSDGADFDEALGYGLINAGIEGLVEVATAKLGKGITSLASKRAGKTTAKTIGKVMIEEGISEGIEEGLVEFLNPIAKTVTYGDPKEEMSRYKDPQFYKDVGYSAGVGGTVGVVTGGAGGYIGREIGRAHV